MIAKTAEENTENKPRKVTVEHNDLGEIVGWARGTDIVQFRGLPYASIPARFRQSILNTSLPSQPYDATQPGPTCPHPPQEYWKYWEAQPLTDLPVLDAVRIDELQCLNLSITAPADALNANLKLPVFVFIHGGAFIGGSHAIQLHGREVFDPTGLVRESLRLAMPMIAIGLNYRVGPLGFLASKELTAFSQSLGEPAGNYGLHDQRQALEWLYKFIGGFGGDPERVTIQGTSAGGASCHFLSLFPERKFKRAILASGTCWGIGAVEEDTAQKTFEKLYSAIRSEQETDALDMLQNVDVEKLNNTIKFDVFNPLIDNTWIFKNALLPPDAETVLPVEIMVGAAEREDDIAEVFLRDMNTWRFKSDNDAWDFIKATFASNGCVASPSDFPFANQKLMQAYGLDHLADIKDQSPRLDLEVNATSWAALLGHVLFNFPTYLLAERISESRSAHRIWLYHFDAKNPYPASHSPDMAHHGVNDLLVFNIAADQIPADRRKDWSGAVSHTQRCWIDFVNGKSPWSAFNSSSKGPIFVFADGDGSQEYESMDQALGSKTAERWSAMRSSFFP